MFKCINAISYRFASNPPMCIFGFLCFLPTSILGLHGKCRLIFNHLKRVSKWRPFSVSGQYLLDMHKICLQCHILLVIPKTPKVILSFVENLAILREIQSSEVVI